MTKALQLFVAALDSDEAREGVYEALAREAARFKALPSGSDRARDVHRQVEEALLYFAELKPEVVGAVRCAKGCGHCCRIWVGITRDEALLLSEWVKSGKVTLDHARLETQRTWASPADFIGKPFRDAACVFLGEEGACSVYEDRPSVCRAVLMTSDPELCRTGDTLTKITAVINPYVELLVSAALTADADALGDRSLAMALGEVLDA